MALLKTLVRSSALCSLCLLAACADTSYKTHETAAPNTISPDSYQQLQQVLEQQDDAAKARYSYRHPAETLSFFEVEPGMTVVEALPGFGWYSKILAPYLSEEGTLIGVNYADSLWPNFEWAKEEFIAERIAATGKFAKKVKEWGGQSAPDAAGYTFDTLPKSLTNKADRVLFIRALHNLNRFNAEHGYLDQALSEAHRVLKNDGILGVVQHASAHKYLDGSTGYLNQQQVINLVESAGFTLIGESQVNTNPKDQATASDTVWRLPPTLWGIEKDSEAYKSNIAIGETNRITLKFKKSEPQSEL